jgi:opine dehydrogenase
MAVSDQEIAVIGAGNSGLAMAAHLALSGHRVRLWNRSIRNIENLIHTRRIKCTGRIEGIAELELVSVDLGEVIDGVNLIMVTTPANSHRDIAGFMAPYLTEEKTIILNPGRTFGVIEVEHVLSDKQVPVMPLVAETQTIVYTCRKTSEDSVVVLSLKDRVLIAAHTRCETETVISRLPDCLRPYFTAAESMAFTSLGNVGAILHCAPVIFNTGWIENRKVDFKYYYDGITPTVAAFLEKLDRERLQIALRLGVHIESAAEWMRRSYNIEGDNLYECIQNNECYRTIDAPRSLNHRYIFEDIPCGLVPLESLGRELGVGMESIPRVIDMASELLDYDFRGKGRTLDRLGLHGYMIERILKTDWGYEEAAKQRDIFSIA